MLPQGLSCKHARALRRGGGHGHVLQACQGTEKGGRAWACPASIDLGPFGYRPAHMQACTLLPRPPELRRRRRVLQDMALGALSSTVAAAGAAVAVYSSTLLPLLSHFASSGAADALQARCKAIECAGLVLQGLARRAQQGDAEATGQLQVWGSVGLQLLGLTRHAQQGNGEAAR
eukprot:350895-Chlamydomonas_euryale.AAC.6